MNVRFCQPDVEDDFIKNGRRKARIEIGDGIVLDIQPVEDEKMKQAALSQLKTRIAHEAASAIKAEPEILESMGEFFRESDFTKHEEFCARREEQGDALESVIEKLIQLPPLDLPAPEDIEILDLPIPDDFGEIDRLIAKEVANATKEEMLRAETFVDKMMADAGTPLSSDTLLEKKEIRKDLNYNFEGLSTKPAWNNEKTKKFVSKELANRPAMG
ncbi:Oidioi.mRNA.OKI2018_I69.chr1.g2101.t1.cds [Oikopleura dioica]|uniref:Oidioi.mRNA.OKI2018_I69.chr1.g2101.t1.cds n=1 Tax=Oikopleura dioica TaxID=34765 RepID=A0ABN7SWB0_OIKDI|nr:Oidioi.mRNA.OKI2018_I69.chr1.g2101.t1.cds [Oikopleura dioica]